MRFIRQHGNVMGGLMVLVGTGILAFARGPVDAYVPAQGNSAVVSVILSLDDGGGYCRLDETGVSRDVRHEGELILARSRSGGSYCCGFTFQVAMDVATERGLLQGKSYPQVKRFQKQWYGSEPGSEARQAALAMETLGIGREVSLERATAGDFVVFYRGRFGHSVILLDTIRRDGKIIGLYYRSSQPGTNGVGNVTEYFTDTGYTNGTILRDSVVVARLNER